MTPWSSRRARGLYLAMLLAAGLSVAGLAGCTNSSDGSQADEPSKSIALESPPRRYLAEWLINAEAVGIESVGSPFVYREVVDDQTGTYLVAAPNHAAWQRPDEVVLCAAVSRLPLDPYCAASPRAEGSPHVLSYPVQLIRNDWSPTALYDLASYREVALVAASEPDAWSRQLANALDGFPIECFLAVGETSAAATGFEICFTDDDRHLVASVDLQNDLIFEIELLSYDPIVGRDDFESGLDEFVEPLPNLQEQLLALYPEIPAPRPTPAPEPVGG